MNAGGCRPPGCRTARMRWNCGPAGARKAFRRSSAGAQPQIYTHYGGDLNVDHQVVTRAVLTATRRT